MFTIKRSKNFNAFGYQMGNGFNPFALEVGKTTSSPERLAFWRSVKPENLPARNPRTVLQLAHRKTMELAFVAALMAVNLVALLARDSRVLVREAKSVPLQIQVADIPATRQFHRPPPPPKPTVPVPTGSEEIPEDVTIVSTELDLTEVPLPPAPAFGDDSAIFVAYDTPPSPIGGFSALYSNLEYPRVAHRAGMEATIVVRVLIDVWGKVESVQILKSAGREFGFEEAVLAVIYKLQWRPAMQRDRAVKVWVTVPVEFTLREETDSYRAGATSGGR